MYAQEKNKSSFISTFLTYALCGLNKRPSNIKKDNNLLMEAVEIRKIQRAIEGLSKDSKDRIRKKLENLRDLCFEIYLHIRRRSTEDSEVTDMSRHLKDEQPKKCNGFCIKSEGLKNAPSCEQETTQNTFKFETTENLFENFNQDNTTNITSQNRTFV